MLLDGERGGEGEEASRLRPILSYQNEELKADARV